jgi:hypothetical protein
LLQPNKNNPRVIFTQAQKRQARRSAVLQGVISDDACLPAKSGVVGYAKACPDYTQGPEPDR